MANELQDHVDDWIDPNDLLPSELLLNDYHPSADEYQIAQREIQQKIFAFGRQMKPEHRELARLYRTSMKPAEIAKKLDRNIQTVYRWFKRDDVIRMVTLMDYLQQQIDGPNVEHRKAILWRIAVDNEDPKPNIAIQAIQEMNKMSGTYQEGGNGGNGNIVQIQINGDILPRGPLDTLPETYETRQAQAIDAEVVDQ
jgi:hypothetical protein